MLNHKNTKVTWSNAAFLLAVGLAALGGVVVLLSGSEVVASMSKLNAGNGCDSNLQYRGVKIKTSNVQNAETHDPLWLCLDSCCKELQPQRQGCAVYVRDLFQYLVWPCGDLSLSNSPTATLVASGNDTWMGNLYMIGDSYVSAYYNHRPMVLSTNPNAEINGVKAKRGITFKRSLGNVWSIDENAPVPFDFSPYHYLWNVQSTTADAQFAKTDDSLWFCVDDCCEKLTNEGEDNYERGQTDQFESNCEAPTDASTIKLVASADDMWLGRLNAIYDQIVEPTSQPLLLSTDADDEISGIKAKRGVTFKKGSDGQWHYDEDVPFDWFPFAWNVKLTTSGVQKAATNDPLYLCVDDCCDKLDNDFLDDYEGYVPDYFLSNCNAPTDESSLKLVSSGGDAWMGHLESVFGQTVHHSLQPLVLSTQRSDEIDGIAAKRGVSFKKQADGEWHFDEELPFYFYLKPWNVQFTTSDVAMAGTDDSLLFCVDDCCEKLNNIGEDNYERGNTDHFLSNCGAPTDASTLKLVASGGDAWMGHLNEIYGQPVEYTSQPLVLSTQSTDEITEIQAKHGVTFKKHADGEWHYAEDVPFDYFVWNVEIATADVSYAAMDGSLRFCVDDCCEKLNNNGEDNYERGRIDHFRSNCKAPTDASTLKLEATNGDGWMGALQNVYGTDVEFHSLVLSTQSSDKIGGTNAKRGATFQKGADGSWHWNSDVSY